VGIALRYHVLWEYHRSTRFIYIYTDIVGRTGYVTSSMILWNIVNVLEQFWKCQIPLSGHLEARWTIIFWGVGPFADKPIKPVSQVVIPVASLPIFGLKRLKMLLYSKQQWTNSQHAHTGSKHQGAVSWMGMGKFSELSALCWAELISIKMAKKKRN